MDVNTGNAKYVYEYNGKKYFFCDETDLANFKADPDKYITK
jgi:YHS domain-containing protein